MYIINSDDWPPLTGQEQYYFSAIKTDFNHPDQTIETRYQLQLTINGQTYQTSASFADPARAALITHNLNTLINLEPPDPDIEEPMPFAFNSVYESRSDIYRLIIHFADGAIFTGCLIEKELIPPEVFCAAMNEQVSLDKATQDQVIKLCILGDTDPKDLAPLH